MFNNAKLLTFALLAAFIFALAGVASLHAGQGGAKHKIEKMDTNGDNAVSRTEFLVYKEQQFDKKDKNGDGLLKEDEMGRYCDHKKGHDH